MATKPRITYLATGLMPLRGVLNTSISRKKIDKSTYRDWQEKNELTSFIDTLYVDPKSDTYLLIICQCGTEFNYATKSDVPTSSVICNCGRNVLIYS